MEKHKENTSAFIKYYLEMIESQSEFERAATMAGQLGDLLCRNNLGVYELNVLETYLIDFFYASLDKNKFIKKTTTNNGTLFVATELYLSGGHSRLMENLAVFLNKKPDLLLTKRPTKEVIERESHYFCSLIFPNIEELSVLDKMHFLIKKIVNRQHLVINIHPDDILAVVACGIAKKINSELKIHFINHADHVFLFGSSIADIWYEISEYGKVIDSFRGLNAKKSFLGIPIKFSKSNISHSLFQDGDLILSAASGIKYKPINNKSLFLLIDILLNEYKSSKFQVVGVNIYRDYWWWRCKIKHGGRLVLSKILDYSDYIDVTSQARLYIDSHPMPGGTAFAEQFLQGRLCSGLISPYQGYSPVEMLKADNEHDVISFIKNSYCYDFSSVYDATIAIHDIENVKARFLSAIEGDCYSTNNCSSYVKNIVPVVKHKIENIPDNFQIFSFSFLWKLWKASTAFGFFKFLIKKMMKRYN